MRIALDDDERNFRATLRQYLDAQDLRAVVAEQSGLAESDIGPEGRRFVRRLGSDGWLGLAWPKELGGGGRSRVEQWLFVEELAYRRLPYPHATLMAIGPTIASIGTPAQRNEWLPSILRGEILCAIGYSEPGAGSDLAAISTRAESRDSAFVVNGHKVYTTGAHYATHVWLAVRTGERSSRHRGLSVLLVPMTTPGITVRPLYTQAHKRTNEVYFDDVTVDRSCLVGQINEGWSAMMMALNFERIQPCSKVVRDVQLIAQVKDALGANQDAEALLGECVVDAEIARLLTVRAALEQAEDRLVAGHASMAKVWMSDARQRIAGQALDALGAAAAYGKGDALAPLRGELESLYTDSPFMRFAAGTNEVQRDLIAQRLLGLPRGR